MTCPQCGHELRAGLPHWQTAFPCRNCGYGASRTVRRLSTEDVKLERLLARCREPIR